MEVLEEILNEANLSPSNCNTQPWQVHIVSGAKRDQLSTALCRAYDEDRYSLDFSFDPAAYGGRMRDRRQEQGRCFYEALSMGRDDADGRRLASRKNLDFYGAPHAALLFVPDVGDCVRVAADVGMYAQTFLLALSARGLGGIPQTILGYFADTVREVLGVEAESKLLFGVSFGSIDEANPANSVRMGRDPASASVTLHS
jgi:nitroreductase